MCLSKMKCIKKKQSKADLRNEDVLQSVYTAGSSKAE